MNSPFPPVETANEEGIVAVGGDFSNELLITAYLEGIFPWPISKEWPLAWFSPDPRGIIDPRNYHVPRRLKRELSKAPFNFKKNTAFETVISECANCNNRTEQTDTWITNDLKNAYINLHQMGLAYSIEAYSGEELVGGLYGVCLGKIVSAESMFFKKNNASKACLIFLLEILAKSNIELLDIQMITPITESLGGTELSRNQFVDYVKKMQQDPVVTPLVPQS